jgi:membrane protein involved in colicin uptake
MVVKAKAPQESEAAKNARERAQADAEKNLVGETRRGVTNETASILRRFGIRAAMSGSPGAGNYAAQGFSGAAGGGSYNPGIFAAFGGQPFDVGGFSRATIAP